MGAESGQLGETRPSSHHMTVSMMDRSHVTETILDLTLEIICLLSGERCAVVKMAAIEGLLQGLYPPLSGDLNPITAPPPLSPTPQRNMEQKVLEVINQVAELLTGESGILRRFLVRDEEEVKVKVEEDGAIQELGHSEGQKELYEAAMMEEEPADKRRLSCPVGEEQCGGPTYHGGQSIQSGCDLPTDGSRKGNARPLYGWDSTQEGVVISLQPQNGDSGHFNGVGKEDMKEEEGENGGTYLEGHRDVYRNIMMYLSSGDPPERSPRPLYSRDPPLEGQEIWHRQVGRDEGHGLQSADESGSVSSLAVLYYAQDQTGVQAEIKKEETGERWDERSAMVAEVRVALEEEEPGISSEHGHRSDRSLEGHPCRSADCMMENGDMVRERGDPAIPQRLPGGDGADQPDPSNPEELFSQLDPERGNEGICCPDCGEHFMSGVSYYHHLRVHLNAKGFQCSQCGKSFKRKTNLIHHQRSHTGERPFSCSECGKRFIDKYKLTIHKRYHTGENLYTCTECGKQFAEKFRLTIHQRYHTREKLHTCSECGRGCLWKSDLDLHMRRHRGEKPFSCSECGKCFIEKSKLNQHQKKFHSK